MEALSSLMNWMALRMDLSDSRSLFRSTGRQSTLRMICATTKIEKFSFFDKNARSAHGMDE